MAVAAVIDANGDWTEPEPDALHPAPAWFDDEAQRMALGRQVAGDEFREEREVSTEAAMFTRKLPTAPAWTVGAIRAHAEQVMTLWEAAGEPGDPPLLECGAGLASAWELLADDDALTDFVATATVAGESGYRDFLMSDAEFEAMFGS